MRRLELAVKKSREETIAEYQASFDFQEVLDAEYDSNFPKTLEDYLVPILPAHGAPANEVRESSRDSTFTASPLRANSIEVVTSSLQEFVPTEGDPTIPSSPAKGDNVDDSLKDLGIYILVFELFSPAWLLFISFLPFKAFYFILSC